MTRPAGRPAPVALGGWFDSPEYRRMAAVRQWFDYAARSVLREHGRPGDLQVTGEPPTRPGGLDFRQEVPAPLAGVRVAAELHATAGAAMRQHAEAARGAGATWDEVGEAIGGPHCDVLVPALQVDVPLGVAAYFWTACGRADGRTPGRPGLYDFAVWWTCSTCGQRVTDHGPEGGHPDDRDEGHGEGCARHAAAVAAYRAAHGDDGDAP